MSSSQDKLWPAKRLVTPYPSGLTNCNTPWPLLGWFCSLPAAFFSRYFTFLVFAFSWGLPHTFNFSLIAWCTAFLWAPSRNCDPIMQFYLACRATFWNLRLNLHKTIFFTSEKLALCECYHIVWAAGRYPFHGYSSLWVPEWLNSGTHFPKWAWLSRYPRALLK